MIVTDAKGRPIEKPKPEDFATATEYLRAHHAYRDRISDVANKAFIEQFQKALKR